MMKRILSISALILLMAVATSCRKEAEERINPTWYTESCRSYLQQFEAVWQGMDQGYMFWEEDTVDWDARYDTYQPIFADFDKRTRNNPVTQIEYWEAYSGLFEGLIDHHLSGRFYSATGKFEAFVSPGRNDYEHSTYASYEREKQISILRKKNYTVPGTFIGFNPTGNVPGSYFCLIKGQNEGEYIAYFRFTEFHMLANLPSASDEAQAPARAFYGDYYTMGITNGYANDESVVGIIIDMRGNGGGSLGDLEPLIGSLAQQPTLLGYTRVKEGPGRLDYSAWSEFVVNAPSYHLNKEKPIVVLADVHSASCAEMATLLIKSLPNGTFIGERTYGATGPLMSGTYSNEYHNMFYNGCFGDPEYFENGPNHYEVFSYYVYTSTYYMVDKDFNNLEGVGIQPDIEVRYSSSALEGNANIPPKDPPLDRAVNYIKNGH